jgi:hypothetical protein
MAGGLSLSTKTPANVDKIRTFADKSTTTFGYVAKDY